MVRKTITTCKKWLIVNLKDLVYTSLSLFLSVCLSLSLSLAHLYNTAITVPDSHVIVDDDSLQMFDQTALEITTSTGLYSCVDQTL